MVVYAFPAGVPGGKEHPGFAGILEYGGCYFVGS